VWEWEWEWGINKNLEKFELRIWKRFELERERAGKKN
jgi:hypothetical protein